MQLKDIPTSPILEFLVKVEAGETYWYPTPEQKAAYGERCAHSSATWYDGFENSVLNAMPQGVTNKMALLKMRTLIKRGLVGGCGCGCRGDFVTTAAAHAVLAPKE